MRDYYPIKMDGLPVDLISERTGLFEPVLYLCLPY